MAHVKLITKAPEDVYGCDKWYLLFNNPTEVWEVKPDNHLDALFVHWSLLTEHERDLVRLEWLLEEPKCQ